MQKETPAWYCARTKAKHEHIAAANLRKNLQLEVFHPQLRIERATRRGVMRVVEPLFPCYVFARFTMSERMKDVQCTVGVSGLVAFGGQIPSVPDEIVEELQECFQDKEAITVENQLMPADEVLIGDGAFAGGRAFVLRVMPAKKRVQVLLDILGQPTPVEMDWISVVRERNSLADLVPALAASF